ncbi:hypothetical protein F5B20DRAFT_584161 [Whalleya microplaca]|nr:hypothetical protein F5B20DRAFT_584161 [Whalleya microplaca]
MAFSLWFADRFETRVGGGITLLVCIIGHGDENPQVSETDIHTIRYLGSLKGMNPVKISLRPNAPKQLRTSRIRQERPRQM